MPETAVAPTETQTAPVTFIAKCKNQILTRRPARGRRDPVTDEMVIVTEDEWMARMRERQEETGETFDDTPWKVEFENHFFTTDHPKLIEWLRSHKTFNLSGPSGFYEEGAAPDEPKPTVDEQMTAIARAAAVYDEEALDAVIALEEETHNRSTILNAAGAAKAAWSESSGSGDDAGAGNGEPKSTSSA